LGVVKIPYITTIYFHVTGTHSAIGDNKDRWEAPYDGEILAYGGSIETLGSGAGDYVEIQLRNSTLIPNLDYFDTKPSFDVDSATSLLEGGELRDAPQFWAGNVLMLDLDHVLTATDSADIHFWVLVQMYREVTV
jgi:hypothetical protein